MQLVREFRELVCGTTFLCALCIAAAQPIGFHREAAKPLSRFTSDQLALLMKVNHTDSANLVHLKYILVPDRWDPNELLYSPMPQIVVELSQEKKAIVVDLSTQTFGAYQFGKLVRWGPVSSGDKYHQTPPGTYHLTWHARIHTSTENPSWVMPWYFNFANHLGLGLHQYALTGRPASHGCVRVLAVDAKWLFRWGDGWTLASDQLEVARPGTPVLVLGKYDFGSPPPWFRLEWWSRSVSLPPQQFNAK